MKRIVVCCDGTWSTPDQAGKDGRPCPTNVSKFALAATEAKPADGVQQCVYYGRGVGTGRSDRLQGGAFGVGLTKNILDAYRFLIAEYEPHDELYFVGYSRGAYAVRSLAGLVRNSGILRPEHRDRINDAYALYRRRDDASEPQRLESTLFRRTYSYERDAFEIKIKFVGVWDTVGSHGIPFGPLTLISRKLFRLEFHDTKLSSKVENAFHAVAIDEQRRTFEPTLWIQQEHAKRQRVQQVWFAGTHANIGGGASHSGLSDLTLKWMGDRAQECGLTLDFDALARRFREPDEQHRVEFAPNHLAPIANSRGLIWRLLGTHARAIHADGRRPNWEYAHGSVYDRIAASDPYYAPENLPPEEVAIAPQ